MAAAIRSQKRSVFFFFQKLETVNFIVYDLFCNRHVSDKYAVLEKSHIVLLAYK